LRIWKIKNVNVCTTGEINMRTETITCDCCGKVLQPEEYFELIVSIKSHGKAGKIPDDINLDDICRECTYEIHKIINCFIKTKRN